MTKVSPGPGSSRGLGERLCARGEEGADRLRIEGGGVGDFGAVLGEEPRGVGRRDGVRLDREAPRAQEVHGAEPYNKWREGREWDRVRGQC